MEIESVLHGISGIRPDSIARRDGKKVPVRCMRDGSPVLFNWIDALCAEGRVFEAQAGTLDTPITQLTSFTATLPAMAVEVPDSVIVIPLLYEVSCVATAAVQRVHLAMSPQKTLLTSAAAFTAITPLNTRLDANRVSGCKAGHSVTVTGGDYTTNARYLTHRGNQGDIDAIAIDGTYKWSLRDCGYLPLLGGGGSLVGFFYNSSGSAFAKLVWAEIDKEDFRIFGA